MTRRKRENERAAIYLVTEIMICFCLCQYGIGKLYGFSVYPDEFGYWAPAAGFLGWDWSEASGTGSYYSFGYSLLLTPVLRLTGDPVIAYRIAVFGNALLMCVGIYVLYSLTVRLFPKLGKVEAALCAGTGALYPAWMFYTQTTMTEALLLFLYPLVLFLFFRVLEKENAVSGIWLAIALAYLFFVHMRGIGTAAAVCAVLAVRALAGRQFPVKKLLPVSAVLAVLVCAGLWAGQVITGRLYGGASASVLEANTLTGQWKRLLFLLRPEGAVRFFAGFLGKLLYTGVATFGLAWRGLAYAGNRSVQLFAGPLRGCRGNRTSRQGNRTPYREKRTGYFWLLLLLSALAQMAVAAAYTAGDLYPEKNLDLFVHGRYCEMVLPVLLVVGLRRMLAESRDGRRLWSGTAGTVIGTGALTGIAAAVAAGCGLGAPRGYFMSGMSYLLREDAFDSVSFLWQAWAFGSAVSILVTLAVFLYRRLNRAEWMLTVLLALQAALGMQVSGHYLYRASSYSYMDMQIAEKAVRLIGLRRETGETEGAVVHIYEGGIQYIDQVQFCLREESVQVWDAQAGEVRPEELCPEDLVITGTESAWNGALEEKYREHFRSGHLILHYNPPEQGGDTGQGTGGAAS